MNSKLSISQRQKIHTLRLSGKSYREISEIMEIPIGVAGYWARVYNNKNSSSSVKYTKPKIRPVKTYKEYLWEGYKRNGDIFAFATLRKRFPKYLAKQMGIKYRPHKSISFVILS